MCYCVEDVKERGKCHSQFERRMGPSLSRSSMNMILDEYSQSRNPSNTARRTAFRPSTVRLCPRRWILIAIMDRADTEKSF